MIIITAKAGNLNIIADGFPVVLSVVIESNFEAILYKIILFCLRS